MEITAEDRGAVDDTKPFEEARLSAERSRLQGEIVALRRGLSVDGDDRMLRTKQAAYNEVIDALRVLRQGPRFDPMDKLPNEIWSSILIHFAVLKNMFTWHNIPRTEHLVPLTRVSKRWRRFLHSEPLLWNVIILRTRRYDNSAIVARQLELSAHLPITLVLHLPFDQWTQVLPELIKHRDRIETIALDEESYLERRQSSASVRQMLEDLFPLPHLRQLGETYEAMRRWQDLPYILERFPSLRQLPNIPVTTELLRRVKDRLDLKEVTTYEDLLSISMILEDMPSIRRVTCQTDPVASLEDFSDSSSYGAFYATPRRLGWTRLTFDTYSYPLPVQFLYRLPYLTSLEIRSDFAIFKAVIAITYQFPSLAHFRASISLTHNDYYNPPDKLSPNSAVRSLEIYMFAPWDMAGNTAGMRLSRGAEIITGMILRAMPASERITLSTTEIPHSFRFFELEGWSRVEDLFIFCSGEVGPTNTPTKVPRPVRFLSIAADEEVLAALSSASVESLCCMAPYRLPSDITNVTPILILTATMWPVLQTLEVYSGLVCWDKSSLSTLRTVKIINRNNKLYVDNGITSFIHTIACQPNSYPSLEEIEMDECPEWDILMIMLERRNLLGSSTISRIKKISVPFICPPNISHIISDILKGKWATRPSNKQLSLAGNAESILNLAT
jgi:hypothetical protein